ncbi:hypothetical protein BT69DRAFT_1349980 [Atractiella rhizophila]|nr:hypothetical protein BT69DRAFT_1349980 [Atractiella rhizophila]
MVATTKSKASLAPSYATQSDEAKYRTKYRELKIKTKEMEDENSKLETRIMAARRQINRLRLERSILYDRLQLAHNAMLPWIHPSANPFQMDHLDPRRLPTIDELAKREKAMYQVKPGQTPSSTSGQKTSVSAPSFA